MRVWLDRVTRADLFFTREKKLYEMLQESILLYQTTLEADHLDEDVLAVAPRLRTWEKSSSCAASRDATWAWRDASRTCLAFWASTWYG